AGGGRARFSLAGGPPARAARAGTPAMADMTHLARQLEEIRRMVHQLADEVTELRQAVAKIDDRTKMREASQDEPKPETGRTPKVRGAPADGGRQLHKTTAIVSTHRPPDASAFGDSIARIETFTPCVNGPPASAGRAAGRCRAGGGLLAVRPRRPLLLAGGVPAPPTGKA